MGMFDKLREMMDQRVEARAAVEQEEQLEDWRAERGLVDELLYMAENPEAVYAQARDSGMSLRMQKSEDALLHVTGAGLVEPRRAPGTYQGGSQGASFRVAKGVSFRVGGHRGQYQAGPEEQTLVDQGDVYITTKRVVFVGSKRNREWEFSSLLSVTHTDEGVTYMQVTNRQKVSGVAYGPEAAPFFRGRVTLALSIYDDELPTLVSNLRDQLNELDAAHPGVTGGELSWPT